MLFPLTFFVSSLFSSASIICSTTSLCWLQIESASQTPQLTMVTEKTSCSEDIERGVNTPATSEMNNWTLYVESRVRDDNILSEERLWKNASIYKVPAFSASLNPKAFTPELVSFGPYHHENEDLKLMEVHKVRALVHFIRKACKPLGKFVASVERELQALQDSYSHLDEKWRVDKDAFLKLMITDGCFMLEVLRFAKDNVGSYPDTDPIFSQHGIQHKMPYIRRDMLLIENQLPLLLLKTLTLAAVETPETNEVSECVDDLVLNFFNGGNTAAKKSGEKMSLRHHALDLYRQSLLCPVASNRTKESKRKGDGPECPVPSNRTKERVHVIRSAFELSKSGLIISNVGSKCLNDISFYPSARFEFWFRLRFGLLRLPKLLVDDSTECTLLNMVAFEHLHIDANHDISSYVCFMSELIDSDKDVWLLRNMGIIHNSLGRDEAVTRMFKQISRELTVDPDSLVGKVRRQVHEYRRCSCLMNLADWTGELARTYFKSPWTALALAGALLLLGLTITQTVYTIRDYYKP